MDKLQRKFAEQGMFAALLEGSVSVSYLFLKTYKKLGLTDREAMLLIHLLSFKQKESNDFPTIEQIQERMSDASVPELLRKLIKERSLSIDEKIDPTTGIRYEVYNFEPLYQKMAAFWADEIQGKQKAEKAESELFHAFEQEFGRPLSPMECETIVNWLDVDRYPEELIIAALKEAVFAGKLHFRYIDRILLEWSRHRITTAEQAKEFAKRFRGMG